jgi:hypothetical protein
MKFLMTAYITTLFLIYSLKSIRLKQKDESESIILKFNEKYYNKIGREHIDNFKNMIFRQLDENRKEKKTDLNDKKDNHIIKNRVEEGSLITSVSTGTSSSHIKNIAGEYISTNRIIQLYVSQVQECSIFINDTVTYENLNNVNFIEHMILHNNAENIDPKGVYSDNMVINFFAFNKKLNIFSVYFDNKNIQKTDNSVSLFNIEYDYDANNLIKSNFVEQKESELLSYKNSYNNTSAINSTNNTSIPISSANFNSFIWKILNQNFLKYKENVTIEIYFELGKEFQNEDVEFSLNFTKTIIGNEKKSIVKYEWKGTIDPQEVIVLQAKFPLYFENCGNISVNLVMIFIGSIFIIFLIGMLYIILSTVFSGGP